MTTRFNARMQRLLENRSDAVDLMTATEQERVEREQQLAAEIRLYEAGAARLLQLRADGVSGCTFDAKNRVIRHQDGTTEALDPLDA